MKKYRFFCLITIWVSVLFSLSACADKQLEENSGAEELTHHDVVETEQEAENQEPSYVFYNEDDSLKLEIYYDETKDEGRGIYYTYYADEDDVKTSEFTFSTYMVLDADKEGEDDWAEPIDDIDARNGDGAEQIKDMVKDYAEYAEYNDEGQMTYFESTGITDFFVEDDMPRTIIEAEFFYREDGSLYKKTFYNTHALWATTGSSYTRYYDEQERLVYSGEYITHGRLEYYFIYEDEEAQPTYLLALDCFGSECAPTFYKYE